MTAPDSTVQAPPAVTPDPDRFFDTRNLSADLKRHSVRGGTVTLVAQGAKLLLQTTSMMCLARLLTPADFGLIAMVLAITGFVMMLKDLGLSMATVQRAEINHGQVSTLFWINVGLSIVLVGVTAGLAPVVAWFYGEPRLIPITLVLAGAFLFGGLTIQHQALLRRQMRFRALAIVDIVAMALSVAVAIASALLGAGYWSLVAMQITLAAATAVGVWWACPWRPGRLRRGTGVRTMLAFGGYLTGFNVLNYFARNLDNTLIGWRWGATPLGLYSRAYSLLLLPIQQVTPPIAAVAIPALSRLNDQPERYRVFYLRALALLTFVTTPIVAVLLVCAEETILVFLGPNWRAAAPIFRILAISAAVQPVMNSAGWLYLSGGRSRALFAWGAAASVVVAGAFFIGLPFGPRGVALSYAIAATVLCVPCMHFATRGSSICLRDLFAANLPTMTAGVLAAAAALGVKLAWGALLPAWATLGACAVVAGSVHVLTVFYGFRKRAEYVSVVNELRTRRRAPKPGVERSA